MINWKDIDVGIGYRAEVSPESVALIPFVKKVLEDKNSTPLSHFYKEGYSDKALDTILKTVETLKGRKVYHHFTGSLRSPSNRYLFIWDNAFVEVSSSGSNLITLNCVSCNEDITLAFKEIATSLESPSKRGYVFAITKGNRLQLTRIGYAGSAFERGNYTEAVCKDYDYIIEDLNSKDPSGRICILDGPPGTGKTYLIKGILMDVQKAMFVIVPPNMIASIGGPELLPLLLSTREEYGKKGPTILILEDADQCLAPRESDNISAISSILNLGDGIFGSLFDIRIIATTNAKAKDLDRAITRDMRLSKRISILPVLYDEANIIYKRITKGTQDLPKPQVERADLMKPTGEKKTFTLAEIYKIARDNGWRPEKTQEEEPTLEYEESVPW